MTMKNKNCIDNEALYLCGLLLSDWSFVVPWQGGQKNTHRYKHKNTDNATLRLNWPRG